VCSILVTGAVRHTISALKVQVKIFASHCNAVFLLLMGHLQGKTQLSLLSSSCGT
jgi:hypothetical protein